MAQLLTDNDWASIDGAVCRVAKFTSLAKVVEGRIVERRRSQPYARLTLECPSLPPDTVAAITHKVDFLHLWAACVDRRLTELEEVNIAWTKSSLRGPARLLSRFMPGLAVMICQAGAYELITNPNYQPELTGEARFKAEMPIVELIPEVLK
jgi:hypothetical protein